MGRGSLFGKACGHSQLISPWAEVLFEVSGVVISSIYLLLLKKKDFPVIFDDQRLLASAMAIFNPEKNHPQSAPSPGFPPLKTLPASGPSKCHQPASQAEHQPGVFVVEVDPSEADRIREQARPPCGIMGSP